MTVGTTSTRAVGVEASSSSNPSSHGDAGKAVGGGEARGEAGGAASSSKKLSDDDSRWTGHAGLASGVRVDGCTERRVAPGAGMGTQRCDHTYPYVVGTGAEEVKETTFGV